MAFYTNEAAHGSMSSLQEAENLRETTSSCHEVTKSLELRYRESLNAYGKSVNRRGIGCSQQGI